MTEFPVPGFASKACKHPSPAKNLLPVNKSPRVSPPTNGLQPLRIYCQEVLQRIRHESRIREWTELPPGRLLPPLRELRPRIPLPTSLQADQKKEITRNRDIRISFYRAGKIPRPAGGKSREKVTASRRKPGASARKSSRKASPPWARAPLCWPTPWARGGRSR